MEDKTCDDSTNRELLACSYCQVDFKNNQKKNSSRLHLSYLNMQSILAYNKMFFEIMF